MRQRCVLWALVLVPACGDDGQPVADTQDASSGAPTSSTTGTSSPPPALTGATTQEPPPPASTSGSSGDSSDGADSTSDETGRPGAPGLDFEMLTIDEPIVRATAIAFFPDSSDFLLASKDGEIVHYALEGDTATRLGGFTLPEVYTPSDCGVISLAFDPDFTDNRLLYVGYCRSQLESAIVRLELGADLDYDAVVATMADVIVVGHPAASEPWHNVGSIGFDPSGNLWAVFGDKTVASSAQDLSNNLGSIIRIVPDRSPGGSGYTAAKDNPFYGDPTFSWDIWAYGLRSPWKALLDDQGRFFIGDVGSDEFEEVNMV